MRLSPPLKTYAIPLQDIDIMMGTFTKSFGSAGGYIAGPKKLIDYLKVHSQASCSPTSVSPPVAMQIVAAMKQIMNKECVGLQRIQRLADNSRYFRYLHIIFRLTFQNSLIHDEVSVFLWQLDSKHSAILPFQTKAATHGTYYIRG